MDQLLDMLPSYMALFCAIFSGLFPYLCYKANKKIHEIADPPWKKND